MRLIELASIIRSKNAGPLQVTIDLMFSDRERYGIAATSPALDAESVAALYGVDPARPRPQCSRRADRARFAEHYSVLRRQSPGQRDHATVAEQVTVSGDPLTSKPPTPEPEPSKDLNERATAALVSTLEPGYPDICLFVPWRQGNANGAGDCPHSPFAFASFSGLTPLPKSRVMLRLRRAGQSVGIVPGVSHSELCGFEATERLARADPVGSFQ
ncbi:MAG: DUF4387 family protein [Rhizobiales bacterium]|nr:DUF4387 family protein [Hyphomicrobiales bacterium]